MEGSGLGVDQFLQPIEPLGLDRLVHLVGEVGAGRAGAGGIFEGIGRGVAHFADDGERVLEVRIGLAGEADDEIARQGHVRPCVLDAPDELHVLGSVVPAVHGLQNGVRARLHRQMQIGHQDVEIAMGRDQRVVHVARMAGGVAQPLQPGQLGQQISQLAQAHGAALVVRAVIGVDVLAEQGDFLDAGLDQPARLGDDLRHGAADLGAARIGHDAEGTELVAPFLHGEERRQPALDGDFLLRRGEMGELVLLGEIGVDHRAFQTGMHVPLRLGARQHVGQAVIGLRPEHHVDHRGAAGDFLALGLRHAAGHPDQHVAAQRPALVLEFLEPPQLGKHLLAGFFADMAGVEQHQIGLRHVQRRLIAMRRQRIAHAVAVIDVHLAPIGLDEQLLGIGAHLGHAGSLPEDGPRLQAPATKRAAKGFVSHQWEFRS